MIILNNRKNIIIIILLIALISMIILLVNKSQPKYMPIDGYFEIRDGYVYIYPLKEGAKDISKYYTNASEYEKCVLKDNSVAWRSKFKTESPDKELSRIVLYDFLNYDDYLPGRIKDKPSNDSKIEKVTEEEYNNVYKKYTNIAVYDENDPFSLESINNLIELINKIESEGGKFNLSDENSSGIMGKIINIILDFRNESKEEILEAIFNIASVK